MHGVEFSDEKEESTVKEDKLKNVRKIMIGEEANKLNFTEQSSEVPIEMEEIKSEEEISERY
jgi:hypothetical protein